MAKRRNDENTGVFRRMLDESATAQRIARQFLSALVRDQGERRLVIACEDHERSLALGRAITAHGLCDVVTIATTEAQVRGALARPVTLCVASADYFDLCTDLIGSRGRVFMLNGHDDETVAQLKEDR